LPPRPELLAPAGSPATWAAALEAGADAVYLGLKEYSARAFAANFSLQNLARVIDLTHERGAKIFVAFNALLKEKDLAQAARNLDALSAIGPDALIIQDLGLLRLIKKHFPHFEVHASTLMAGHNLPGMAVLAGLGFDRAVLARELTLSEVSALADRSPLPVELFIHGALCFSVSGLCLMSSFLGGKGSLRGACTQPCRRAYTSARKKGFFFSPTDLDTSELMGRLRQIPLAALKIEGRMKGAEYVSRVVKAYRMLLDAPLEDLDEVLPEAAGLIEASLGRQRSTGFLLSSQPPSGLAPSQAATSGLFIGKVTEGRTGGGLLIVKQALEIGDRLRVSFKDNDERQAFSLRRMTGDGQDLNAAPAGTAVTITAPVDLSPGDLVFKVDSGTSEKEALASPLMQAVQSGPARDIKPSPRLNAILAELKIETSAGRTSAKRPALWYRVGRMEEVSGLEQLKPDRIIVPATTANIRRGSALRRRLGPLFERVIWALPPLVFQEARLRRDLSQLNKMGAREYMISNLGHLALLDQGGGGKGRRRPVIYADYRLNCLNTQAEAQLAALGLNGLTISVETDEENLQRLLQRPGPTARLLYLYGRPPLFTSRFKPYGLKDNHPVESPRHERFRVNQEGDFFVTHAEQPIFFAPLLKLRSLPGVTAFIIDLEYDPRPAASAKEVTEAVARGKPIGSASRFNFKRGLF
jgi:putative protease